MDEPVLGAGSQTPIMGSDGSKLSLGSHRSNFRAGQLKCRSVGMVTVTIGRDSTAPAPSKE